MVIRLSPTMEERVEQAAKAKGIEPGQLVEEALDKYLAKDEPRQEVSEARRQLRELMKDKKPAMDFDAALHDARRYARQLEEDNADWIESLAKHRTQPTDQQSPEE